MSVLPRHLCTSFWTTTKVSSVHALHAQVLCAMTVHPAKNTVHQSIVQIAAYVQLVPTRVLMDPAVYRVLQVTRRNNYFIFDISIVRRQVIKNHFICLARRSPVVASAVKDMCWMERNPASTCIVITLLSQSTKRNN